MVLSSADHCGEAEIFCDSKTYRCKETVLSNSEDSFAQGSHWKHQRYEDLDDEQQRSTSDTEGLPGHGEVWHKHHHRNSDYNGKPDKCCGGYSQGHHQDSRENDVKRKRPGCDIRRDNWEYHSHGSRYLRHKSMSTDHELSHEWWHMVSGSLKDSQEDYQHYHRKNVY
uniref:Uncharacterized protein n=1 Tax=Rhizophora mucronata TaxID=61149 RepID=A0A2P2NYK4_RHIMU